MHNKNPKRNTKLVVQFIYRCVCGSLYILFNFLQCRNCFLRDIDRKAKLDPSNPIISKCLRLTLLCADGERALKLELTTHSPFPSLDITVFLLSLVSGFSCFFGKSRAKNQRQAADLASFFLSFNHIPDKSSPHFTVYSIFFLVSPLLCYISS